MHRGPGKLAELLAPASQRRPRGSACSACGWAEPAQGRLSARLPGSVQSGSRPSPPCLSAASVPSAGPPRASPESAWSPPELAHYGSLHEFAGDHSETPHFRGPLGGHGLPRTSCFRSRAIVLSGAPNLGGGTGPARRGGGKRIPARNRGGFCAGQRFASG